MAQPKANTTNTSGTPPPGPDLNMVFAPLRPDLIFQRQRFKNEEYYVVKDPLSLAYFRLRPEETFLLHLLDGKRTLREITEIYEEEFPNNPRSPQDVAQFCNQVGRSGLLVINARSFIDIIKNKPKPKYSLFMLWVKAVSKLMFFKFPLLDPSPWLGKLVHQVRFLWSTPVVLSCLVFYAFTGLWVFFHREAFEANTINFFSPANLIWLPFITIFIKTCHEFGHATTCARFGGEVHEMGVCCICFMPCGYVDASDAWMMRRKSHKIYVTIAGVFTEFMIASICAYLW
ncbi:MAG TPA: hypothetical protein PLV25_00295, partial [Opitutales bacterium]|nr:hypothetical protein [Opitutales bacterium]